MANKKDFIASGPTKPDIQKSKFDLSYTNNFTASFGKIYPLGSWLLPAGSSFKCDCTYGFDLQPLVFPVQTNMRFHVKFYKAPLRILWKNWRNLVSRGGKGYELPYINRNFNFYETCSLSDYMGVPSFQTASSSRNHTTTFGVNIPLAFQSPISLETALSLDIVYNREQVRQFDVQRPSFYVAAAAPVHGWQLLNISSPFIVHYKPNDPTVIGRAQGVFLALAEKVDNLYYRVLEASTDFLNTGAYGNLSLTIPNFIKNPAIYDGRTDLFFLLIAPYSSHLLDVHPSEFATPTQSVVLKEQSNYEIEQTTSIFTHRDFSTYITWKTTDTSVESNATHFMSVDGAKPKLPLLAFRWRMYEFIYNYFIRNERVTPFMLPDGNGVMSQVFNQYLTNDGDGADSTTPVDFKYAPYEYDLFTTCVKQPTFGDAPLVGVSFNYNMSGDSPTGEFLLLRDGESQPETYQVSLDDQGRLTGITSYSVDASHPNVHNLQEIINFGVSINDLRNVSAYQRFLERMVKAGTKYENIMYEFFGTNPPIGEEFPSYLGGYTQMIRTDKVLNQTASDSAKLGEYGGNAYLRSKDGLRPIRAFCQEDCYIMAVGWFSVTPTYSQKLDKDFVYTNYLDFVNPAFASISPQPVYDYQIAPLEINPNDEDALTHVFGYNRPFAEAVSRQDECHGLFRSNMQGFIMQRIFGGVPQLNERFLYMRPEDLTQIFAVTDTTDKIFGQIAFKVNATLPLPHMAIPKIL